MSKNNFFVKFGYFYKCNLYSVKNRSFDTFESLFEILSSLLSLFVSLFWLIVWLLCLVIPVFDIVLCFVSRYLTESEADELNTYPGYKLKSLIKKEKAKIKHNAPAN
jgi:hypothetical protein